MALNTYTLIPSFNIGGQFAQCVWHWQLDDASFVTSKSAASDLISKFDTARRTTLRSILPSLVTLVSYKSSRVSADGGFEAHFAASGSVAGTRGSTVSAAGLAPCIIHYPTNLSLGRGRTFLPGIAENDVESGIFTAGYTTAVGTALDTLFDPVTLTGGGQATFGYFRRPQKVFVALVNSILSQNLGTQRRRMRPV